MAKKTQFGKKYSGLFITLKALSRGANLAFKIWLPLELSIWQRLKKIGFCKIISFCRDRFDKKFNQAVNYFKTSFLQTLLQKATLVENLICRLWEPESYIIVWSALIIINYTLTVTYTLRSFTANLFFQSFSSCTTLHVPRNFSRF